MIIIRPFFKETTWAIHKQFYCRDLNLLSSTREGDEWWTQGCAGMVWKTGQWTLVPALAPAGNLSACSVKRGWRNWEMLAWVQGQVSLLLKAAHLTKYKGWLDWGKNPKEYNSCQQGGNIVKRNWHASALRTDASLSWGLGFLTAWCLIIWSSTEDLSLLSIVPCVHVVWATVADEILGQMDI